MLTKSQILQSRPRETRDIHVEEFGGVVRIRALTTSERSRFESSLQTKGKSDPKKVVLVREKLLVQSVVDDSGNLMFSEADIPALSAQPAKAVEKIFNAIQELSGFSDVDVESLEKNSEASPVAAAT